MAYAAAGAPLIAVWERFSLIPFLDPYLAATDVSIIRIPWWSWLIWIAGIAWFLMVELVTATAVARVSFEQMRGDDFFEIREAYRYVFGRIGTIIATPLMPLLFAVLIVIGGLILSLLGAIPVVGEILVGILAIPAFGASLFIVYLLVIFIAALVLTPPVVGSTRNDAFDSLFEVFSTVNEQTWRLVVYSLLLVVLAVGCGGILGWLSLQAIRTGSVVLHSFMGAKLAGILSGAPFYLRLSLPSWCPFYRLAGYGGMLFGGSDLAAAGASLYIAALLVGIAAYAVLLFVAGYALSIWHTGGTIMFCVLLRKKDDKDLLNEKDTDELLGDEKELPPGTAACSPGSPGGTNDDGDAGTRRRGDAET
jgi:hypothetical protein